MQQVPTSQSLTGRTLSLLHVRQAAPATNAHEALEQTRMPDPIMACARLALACCLVEAYMCCSEAITACEASEYEHAGHNS